MNTGEKCPVFSLLNGKSNSFPSPASPCLTVWYAMSIWEKAYERRPESPNSTDGVSSKMAITIVRERTDKCGYHCEKQAVWRINSDIVQARTCTPHLAQGIMEIIGMVQEDDVCESCCKEAYDNAYTTITDEETVSFAQSFGYLLPDHLCDSVDDSTINCACSCRKREG